jgi:two-component system CheB/CheR fusion protein
MKNYTYVGIGASAGGLRAFEELLPLLPKKENFVYIIAQHLDANRESALVEILSHYTVMPIQEITKGCTFLPNHIYIIPPGFNLLTKNNHLSLQKREKSSQTPTPSADMLFNSLAEYKRSNSVGIILTGSGSDGVKGLKSIKEKGGITIAQSADEAEFESMPLSAIQSKNIDYILKLKEIATNLIAIVFAKNNALCTNIAELESPLKTIRQLLIDKENIDISSYKNETVLRRINKRMTLLDVKTFQSYLSHIKTHTEELHHLHQDILIGVTTFFRDSKAFEALKSELFVYLEEKPNNYKLRLWSVACSTGEEAYSLAILVTEISKELNKNFNIHIFATDIDEVALSKARKGIYQSELLVEMDPLLLEKYFTSSQNSYTIVDSIRKKIVFTNHNILNDPPFVSQDLISCRNFLIYILPQIQKELFKLFNYALKEDAILFLGSSESTINSLKYFSSINKEHKIYKKETLKTQLKISPHYFSQHLKEKEVLTTQQKNKTRHQDEDIEQEIADKVFNFFAPNCILINKEYSIIYKKGALPFINISDGFVSLNILENIDKKLRYDLKVIINRAFSSTKMQESKFIEFNLEENDKKFIKIIAHPFQTQNSAFMVLLYFQQLNAKDLQFNTSELLLENDTFMLESLSSQIEQLQEDNHHLADELIINKENMQLLNEELQSSNEELQSSNEELETSNEELQSSNEELHLSIHNEQITQQKLSEILNSSQDGIIGLDLEGNHTFVNRAVLNILGFSEDELIGNNAHRIWHHTKADGSNYHFDDCTLHHGLISGKSVRIKDLFWKKDGTSLEVEVSQNPIIHNKQITGAVLSFHDITKENALKKELEHEHALGQHYLNISGTLVMTLNVYGNISMINDEGCKILKLRKSKLIGKNFIDNFIPLDTRSQVKKVFYSVISGQKNIVAHYKNSIIDANKEVHAISWMNNFTKDENGKITGLITSGIDITQEERLSNELQKQEQLYKLTFEEAEVGIAHVSLDAVWIDTNEYLSNLLGYSKEEFKSLHVSDITLSSDIDNDKIMINKLLNKDMNSYNIDKRYIHKNGEIIWVNISVVLLKDDVDKPLYFLKIIRDITQLKLLMYDLEQEKERFKKIIEFIPIPILIYNENGEILVLNKIFKDKSGYQISELSDTDTFIKKLFPQKSDEKIYALKKYYKNPLKTKEVQEQVFTTKSSAKMSVLLNAVSFDTTQQNTEKIFIVAMIDVTDIKEKDELMMAQSRQAAMGEMLSMIAHQWRQPLSVISMLANNIKVDIDLENKITTEDLEEMTKSIGEQTAYLSHTIDDFRNFFKPDTKREDTSIEKTLGQITTLIKKSLDNNNISLELPSSKDIVISTYAHQLIQVLINIINNAKDALVEKNPQDAFIKVGLKEEKDKLILSICDNAGGIDASIKDRLGEAYVSTKSRNGTGLGLYMSIVIVEKHLKGRLYWESDRKGTCFYIALPLVYED